MSLTFETKWIHEAGGSVDQVIQTFSPTRTGPRNSVLYTLESGVLVCIDSAGAERWRWQADSPLVAPAWGDLSGDGSSRIVIADGKGRVYCLSAEGVELWRVKIPGAMIGPYNTPVLADLENDGNQSIILTDRVGTITCLDASGTVRWQVDVDHSRLGPVSVADVDGDGRCEVFFASERERVYCLDAEGRPRWYSRIPGHYGRSACYIADLRGRTSLVVGGSHLHTAPCVWCLDAATGERIWKYETRLQVYCGISIVDIDGDGEAEIIIGDKSSTTFCLNADGSERWKTPALGGGTWFSPAVADINGDGRQEILFGPRTGGESGKSLLVLDDTGEVVGTYEGDNTFSSYVCVEDIDGDGVLEVLAAVGPTGKIHCFTAGGGFENSVLWGEMFSSPEKTCCVSLAESPGAPALPEKAGGSISVPDPDLTYGRQPLRIEWEGAAPEEALVSVALYRPGEGLRAKYHHLLGGETGAEIEIAPDRAGEYSCELALWDERTVVAEWSALTAPRLADGDVLRREADALEVHLPDLITAGTDPSGIQSLIDSARVHADRFDAADVKTVDLTVLGNRTSHLRSELVRLNGLAEGVLAQADVPTAPVLAWWLDDAWSKGILLDAPPEQPLDNTKPVFAYGGEYESVAFAVLNTTVDRINVRVVVDRSTKGTQYRRLVDVRRVVCAPTNDGGHEPEALPPLGAGGTLSIAPWSVEVVWLTFHADGLEPGVHDVPITVQPLEFGAEASTLLVSWEIAPLSLPEKHTFTTCVWRNPSDYAAYGEETVRAVKEDMRSHGINVFPMIGGEMTFDAEGHPAEPPDWSVMDRQVDDLRDIALRFLVGEPSLVFSKPVEMYSEAYRRAFGHWVRALKTHLTDIGLTYDDVAWYPQDEPCLVGGQRLRVFLDRARLMRWADPDFPIYANPVGYVTGDVLENMAPFVDVWSPYLPLLRQDGRRGDEVRAFFAKCNKPVWSYEADWRKRRQPPIEGWRARGWTAFHYGMSGFGFWTYSFPGGDDVWVPEDSADAEWSIVYAHESVVSSRAWEASRDSMEDWYALTMLAEEIDRVDALGTVPDVVNAARGALRAATTEVNNTQFGATEVGRSARRYPIELATYERLRRIIADWTLKLKTL